MSPHRVGTREPCPVCGQPIYPASRPAHAHSQRHRRAVIRQKQEAEGRRIDEWAIAQYRRIAAERGLWQMTESVYLTRDGTPFIVTPLLGSMPCRIPVLPGDDGAATEPLEARTGHCPHRAEYLIGTGAVCGHHMEEFFRIAGTKPRMSFPSCVPEPVAATR